MVVPQIVSSFLFHVALSLFFLLLKIRINYLFSVESQVHI